jgi:hypothetical protein
VRSRSRSMHVPPKSDFQATGSSHSIATPSVGSIPAQRLSTSSSQAHFASREHALVSQDLGASSRQIRARASSELHNSRQNTESTELENNSIDVRSRSRSMHVPPKSDFQATDTSHSIATPSVDSMPARRLSSSSSTQPQFVSRLPSLPPAYTADSSCMSPSSSQPPLATATSHEAAKQPAMHTMQPCLLPLVLDGQDSIQGFWEDP